jgi:hypothetical protein
MLDLIKGVFGGSKEQRFWKWFVRNEARLFQFEDDQEAIFSELGERLRAVYPDLAFEFGPVRGNGKRDFVISADGLLSAFEAVEALATEAPHLARWSWVKFRQRGSSYVEFTFDDITVNSEQVCYVMTSRGSHVDVTIYFQNYNQERHAIYEQSAFLILDHLLGEFDVVTRVAYVQAAAEQPIDLIDRKPLCELPAEFDAYLAKQRKGYH